MSSSNSRANAPADRLILDAMKLANFAEGLSDPEWNKSILRDGRTIGVVIDQVTSVYPVEVELAQTIGKMILKHPNVPLTIKIYKDTGHAMFNTETDWIRNDYLDYVIDWVSKI